MITDFKEDDYSFTKQGKIWMVRQKEKKNGPSFRLTKKLFTAFGVIIQIILRVNKLRYLMKRFRFGLNF